MKFYIKLVFGKIHFEITAKGAVLTWTIEDYQLCIQLKICSIYSILVEITVIHQLFFVLILFATVKNLSVKRRISTFVENFTDSL